MTGLAAKDDQYTYQTDKGHCVTVATYDMDIAAGADVVYRMEGGLFREEK